MLSCGMTGTDPNKLSYYANPREWHVHLWCQDQTRCGRHYQLVVQDVIGRYGDLTVAEFRRRLKCKCGQGVDWRASAGLGTDAGDVVRQKLAPEMAPNVRRQAGKVRDTEQPVTPKNLENPR